jgi:hypothetical protein
MTQLKRSPRRAGSIATAPRNSSGMAAYCNRNRSTCGSSKNEPYSVATIRCNSTRQPTPTHTTARRSSASRSLRSAARRASGSSPRHTTIAPTNVPRSKGAMRGISNSVTAPPSASSDNRISAARSVR